MATRSGKKTPFLTWAEYFPLRSILTFLQILPYPWSRAASRRIIRGLLRLLPKRRSLVLSQLAACFPDRSPAQLDQLADKSLDILGDGLATFARIATWDTQEMEKRIVTHGFEHITEAFKQGKGMITFTAHYGCWELMAVYVTRIYPRVSMVVRPLDNPRVDAMVTGIRGSGGGGVIDSKKVLKEGIRLLRSNGILGVLIDQNFYKGGVFVDFFGRPAATNTLVPILARRTGCVVLPMHNAWKEGKLHIYCEAPVELSSNPDVGLAVGEDTQKLTGYVERWIREDPTQWLWLHNRWKRRPEPGDPIFKA